MTPPDIDGVTNNELRLGEKVPEEVQAAARAVLRRLAWYERHTARG